jgi:hypothetical protein
VASGRREGPDYEAGAALDALRRGAASPARQKFTVPLFRRKNLQKLE